MSIKFLFATDEDGLREQLVQVEDMLKLEVSEQMRAFLSELETEIRGKLDTDLLMNELKGMTPAGAVLRLMKELEKYGYERTAEWVYGRTWA